MSSSFRTFLLAASVIAPGLQSAYAVTLPTTLDQLLMPGATASFGGETYNQFSAVWGNGEVNTGPPTTGVGVGGVFDGSEPGLLFTGTAGPLAFANTPSATLAGVTFGASLIYDVTAAPGDLIDDFTIAYSGAETGTSSISVSGAIRDLSLHNLGTFSFTTASGGTHVLLSTPESEVQVFTSITLSSGSPIFGGTTGSASLTSLQETFSESIPSTSPVPEPAMLCLLSVGLLGCCMLRRRAARSRIRLSW